jgi:fibronectin-binding autotransporter adhesin
MRSLQNLCAMVTLFCVAALPSRVAAQTYTWTGASSASWSDALNWNFSGGGNAAPTNGSTVLFNNLSTGHLTDNSNDIAGLNLAVIQVVAAPSALTIGGSQPITLGTAGTSLNLSGATALVTINASLVLGAAQTWSVNNTAAQGLTVGGLISGSGNLTLSGAGNNSVFTFMNTGNSYSGTVVVGPGNLDAGPAAGPPVGNGAFSPNSLLNVGVSGTSQARLNGSTQTVAGLDVPSPVAGTRRVVGNSATLSTLIINIPSGTTHSYSSQVGTNGATGGNLNNIAVTKTGGGLQELTQADLRYVGNTTISAGALGFTATTFASSTASTVASYLVLDGGVFQNTTAMTFNRNLLITSTQPTAGQNFQWSANGGGFSAKGGILTVNITVGGVAGAAIDWGTTVGTNLVGTLKFGHETATNQTLFQNGLNLNGAVRTIDVADNTGSTADFATISGTIADGTPTGGGVSKTGNGLLELAPTGSNTYTGTTTVNAGILSATKTAALPGFSSSGSVSVLGGATLQVRTGGAGEWTSIDVSTLLTNATFATGSILGLEVLTGPVDFSTYPTLRSDMGLRKSGAGTLVIPNSQSYTGGTTIAAGIVQIGQNNSLGTGSIVLAGGTLSSTDTTPRTIANVTSLAFASTLGDATNSGALTFTQPLVTDTGSARTLTVASPVTLAGGLSQGTITKAGTARLTIQSTSSLASGNIPGFVVNAGELFIDSGASLTLNGNTAIRVFSNVAGQTAVFTIQSGGTFSLNTTSGNLRVGYDGQNATGSATANIAGTFQATAFTTGGKVTFDDEGTTNTLNLQPGGLLITRQIDRDNSATGTAQGILNIDGGTIRAVQTNTTFIGSGAAATSPSQVNILGGGATIDSNGFDVTVPQALLAGTGSAGGLTKVGAGTLTLTGANTFTGPTIVNAGKLTIGATGTLASASVIVGTAAGSTAVLDVTAVTTGFPVGAGKTLGGHGTVAGPVAFSGGTLSPGASTGILTMTGAVTMNPASTMFVELNGKNTAGIDYDQLSLVGGGTIDLAGATLTGTIGYAAASGDSITIVTGGTVSNQFASGGTFAFGGYTGTITYNPTSVVLTGFTPVPEPAGVMLACGGLAGLMSWWRQRRTVHRRDCQDVN